MASVRSRVWQDGKQIADDFPFEEISDYLARADTLTWVDLTDPDHELLLGLADELSLDPLAVEDAIERVERPKALRYASHTFFTVYATVCVDEPAAAQDRGDGIPVRLELHKISAFVLPNGLVTVHNDGFDVDGLLERWQDNADLLRYGVGTLVHGLLDSVVDSHFETVQVLDDTIEGLEDGLFDDRAVAAHVQRSTYQVRKELVQLRRVVLPMREVVNGVLRHRHEAGAAAELDASYDDLYDHVLRVTEWTESLRDMVTAMFETNLSLQDSRLNNVMKKLTGWAAIIAVPTAVTGYFGQNVPYPGFGKWWGFLLSVGVIVGIGSTLYVVFKRKNWI
ncbi:MAG: magnesium transporter CorA family protein [Microbacteriaceae bacterium]|nr:magnesium transporter CorA family protein [Microbacteriaceae bacterium]MCL2793916.1 magnesium transporter CorA family protein [Microbacteriaceae bacterium]